MVLTKHQFTCADSTVLHLVGLQLYSALPSKPVDSALSNQCMPLQLSVHLIMVYIGTLFGRIALSTLKDVHNSEEPFVCRKREVVMSEHQFLCRSDIACDLHT